MAVVEQDAGRERQGQSEEGGVGKLALLGGGRVFIQVRRGKGKPSCTSFFHL